MKVNFIFLFLIVSSLNFNKPLYWGPEGHAIVGRIAMQFLKEDVKKNVEAILGGMPIDSAANWMDKMKSDQDYDFMRSWHYIDFPKGQGYTPNNNENIINRLILTYNELSHKKILCNEQIKMDLLILIHLMGDLHMPLHTAYEDDLGGNKTIVQYDSIKTHNLHLFWDEDIIRLTNITDADCLQFYDPNSADTMNKIDFVSWMNDSRSLLGEVYNFPGFTLDQAYLNKNKIVVEKQLLKAGLRLAFILNKLFVSPTPSLDFATITTKYKNGIDVKKAMTDIGKKVTVCSRVYGIRSTTTITQVSLGEKYPNSPLTIVIFAKSYSKFKLPLDELLKDKNICVKGTLEEYKGKAQIIIDDPDDIIIL